MHTHTHILYVHVRNGDTGKKEVDIWNRETRKMSCNKHPKCIAVHILLVYIYIRKTNQLYSFNFTGHIRYRNFHAAWNYHHQCNVTMHGESEAAEKKRHTHTLSELKVKRYRMLTLVFFRSILSRRWLFKFAWLELFSNVLKNIEQVKNSVEGFMCMVFFCVFSLLSVFAVRCIVVNVQLIRLLATLFWYFFFRLSVYLSLSPSRDKMMTFPWISLESLCCNPLFWIVLRVHHLLLSIEMIVNNFTRIIYLSSI